MATKFRQVLSIALVPLLALQTGSAIQRPFDNRTVNIANFVSLKDKDTFENPKDKQLEHNRVYHTAKDATISSDQGIPIAQNRDTLKAGTRGPSLLEDFWFREKMTHFDHERIPERVVHARGSGAHGFFQPYSDFSNITKAKFLSDPSKKTPVFVRFSTVVGFKGSPDTVRDVRGFATKFYTEEGNFDLVGNNMPVFFIQDAVKFPDVIHAAKPEPDWEIPQAQTAHDTFWDFVGEQTETLHHVMWAMSMRALPRAFANMEGFGVNSFKFVNAKGEMKFIKWHWKTPVGVHSLVWDETQKIAGKDPDFNRRDLWEDIEAGNYPEYELGVQIFDEADAERFIRDYKFDHLDATKLIPEELVPVTILGKMILNKNPDNFFAETEQVAFHLGNIVPGIDFSDDPLLQGRLFSYLDTQLIRLGGPNFHQIPINRPICPFHINNQRQGYHQHMIHVGKTNYHKNAISGDRPAEAPEDQGFVTHPQPVSGVKIRDRSATFAEHFSQATMFWKSMSAWEQDHIVEAFSFELGKVQRIPIREKVANILQAVDGELASRVAANLGVVLGPNPFPGYPMEILVSPALSQQNQPRNSIKSRKIAVLVGDGFDWNSVGEMKTLFEGQGAMLKFVGPHFGDIKRADGESVPADGNPMALPSVVVDAVYIPGGNVSVQTLLKQGKMLHYVLEAYMHFKPIAAAGEGVQFLKEVGVLPADKDEAPLEGVLTWKDSKPPTQFFSAFRDAIAQHRFFNRPRAARIPA